MMVAIVAVLMLAGCASKKPIPGIEQLNQPVVKTYVEQKAVAYDGKVQVIAWNIEEGKFWKDSERYLEAEQAKMPETIFLLCELDRMHSRSGDVFVADELARALKMNMIFVTEYFEYNDQTKDTPGDHGNAILSPFPLSEITDPKNDFNLNLPRYIDSTEPEDLQDIDGHLRGGIPDRDIDALDR
jgi:hypothetical protein